jgi:predicted ATPase
VTGAFELSNSFVGRTDELSALWGGALEALDGHARLFLLTGEPGIGKTRIASEIADRGRAQGMRIVWSVCCDGVGAPPYWPFAQVVRALSPQAEVQHLGVASGDIVNLIGRFGTPIVDPREAQEDPERARFRLFEGVAAMLAKSAGAQPLLLIVDDFHEADEASWLMLRFVARELREARIMIVVAFRSAEIAPLPLAISADLYRIGRRLSLTGLSESEVRDVVARQIGRASPRRFAAALHRVSGGNPFFVTEVLRTIDSTAQRESAALPIPETVRLSIQTRLRALEAPVVSILSVAAVIGTRFEAALLQRVAVESGARPTGLSTTHAIRWWRKAAATVRQSHAFSAARCALRWAIWPAQSR